MKTSTAHSKSQMFAIAVALLCMATQAFSHEFSGIVIEGDDVGSRVTLSISELGGQKSTIINSRYFDKAMEYHDSTFRTISFAEIINWHKPVDGTDAVLLNCRDDYQGVLSIEDIKRYDLRLATEIRIRSNYYKPSWLNPLLVIVPDGVEAPIMERFMTANITELLFVRLEDYYAPLTSIADKFPDSKKGLQVYQDNCLYCHSIKSVGGNKGTALLSAYDFSKDKDSAKFRKDFAAFHNPGNEEKQNVDQYITLEQLNDVAGFLKAAGR